MSSESKNRLSHGTSEINRRQILQGTTLVIAGTAVSASSAVGQTGRPATAPSAPNGPVTVNVSNAKMQVTGEGVVVTDPTLASVVRSNRDEAAQGLTRAVPGLKASEISVDSAGRVLIRNKDFTSKVQSAKIGDINLCNINFKCGADPKGPVKK